MKDAIKEIFEREKRIEEFIKKIIIDNNYEILEADRIKCGCNSCYTPDLIVEKSNKKYIIEIKRNGDFDTSRRRDIRQH